MLKEIILLHRYKAIRFTAFISVLLMSSHSIAIEEIDKTIAIVGEDIIFSSQLNQRVQQAKKRLTAQKKTVNEKRLRTQLLDNLILETIQLNVARENNVTANKNDMTNAIRLTEAKLRRNGTTLKAYSEINNITIDEMLKELKRDVTIKKMQQGVINQRISVTDKEIDNFLDSKAGKEWLTPRFRLGHLFLPANKDTMNATLKQAQGIFQQLQSPQADFALIAKQYSKGPNASKGGDLGVQTKTSMPALFAEKVDFLDINETSAPFTSPAGVHILKLFSRNGAKPVVVTQYKARHILIKATKLFTVEEAETKINTLYTQLIEGGNFTELASTHTDDIGSKLSGGDLGWSSPGVFVPEFETAMQNTPVNTISKPFRSQFGWHVLTVEGIRKKDIFETVKRQQVVKILKNQRFQDELQIWLKELRESVYVELRN
jgi:peptidyl-prolyl cis-trans isomerase SurA